MVQLRHKLKNGSVVEIITSSKQHPSKDWLEFVKTPRARTRIRQWIKNQERDESISLGKSILEKALEIEHLTLPGIMKSEQLSTIAKGFSFHSVEDMIAQIGFGNLSPRQVIGRLKPKLDIKDERPSGIVSKMVGSIKRRRGYQGIKVKGVSDMLVRFANCCHPVPGESVIGFITRGRGVTIHHKDCRHIVNAEPERLVDVYWEPSKDETYLARLRVTSVERKGILSEVSTIMTHKDANIVQADVKTTMDKKGIALFTIEVENYKQLQDIMATIKKVKNVLIVERL